MNNQPATTKPKGKKIQLRTARKVTERGIQLISEYRFSNQKKWKVLKYGR